MDKLNLRVLVSADNSSGDRLTRALDAINASPYKDRFRVLAGIDFRNVGPGWGEKAVQQLEADIKAGAVGVGEIAKSFGLTIRKPDGSRLKVDDPELDPIWDAFARLDIPVFIHTAEPQEFFQPLDFHNERWLELSLFANRRNNQPGQVTFEELMTERNNLFRKHPKTRFIAAHFGWHANDLQAGRRACSTPIPTSSSKSARSSTTSAASRAPRASSSSSTRTASCSGRTRSSRRNIRTTGACSKPSDEYFDYYRDYHAFWKLYGMDLPDDVLKKVYYRNALNVIKGLPRDGWPQ